MKDELKRLQEISGIIDTPGDRAYIDDELDSIIDALVAYIGRRGDLDDVLATIKYNVLRQHERR